MTLEKNDEAKKNLVIDVQSDHPQGDDAAQEVQLMAKRFLSSLGLNDIELSIVITSDSRISALNEHWRSKKEVTDVLSFPACQDVVCNHPRLLGDIVISLDTAQKQANSQKIPRIQELARYLAHGILHLLGYDHLRTDQAAQMASMEERLLGEAGMVSKAIFEESES